MTAGSTSDQALDVGKCIFFGTCRPKEGFDDLEESDIEVEKIGQYAMSGKLELPPQYMFWLHGKIGMLAYSEQLLWLASALIVSFSFICFASSR
jgi:hypothetical protein